MATRKSPAAAASGASPGRKTKGTNAAESGAAVASVPRMAPMAAGVAHNVQVIRCADAVAAAELLANRELAQCILGALDERHLVIDPGREQEFAKAAVAHRVVLTRVGAP